MPIHQHAKAATANFNFSKSSQGLVLGCLALPNTIKTSLQTCKASGYKTGCKTSLLHNPSNFNTAQAKSYVGAVIFTENYTRPTSLRQAKGWRIRTKNRQYMWTALSLNQGLLYRWTEHSILPISTGGGLLFLIMLQKLTQSF